MRRAAEDCGRFVVMDCAPANRRVVVAADAVEASSDLHRQPRRCIGWASFLGRGNGQEWCFLLAQRVCRESDSTEFQFLRRTGVCSRSCHRCFVVARYLYSTRWRDWRIDGVELVAWSLPPSCRVALDVFLPGNYSDHICGSTCGSQSGARRSCRSAFGSKRQCDAIGEDSRVAYVTKQIVAADP